jgi:hypothetical protein
LVANNPRRNDLEQLVSDFIHNVFANWLSPNAQAFQPSFPTKRWPAAAVAFMAEASAAERGLV